MSDDGGPLASTAAFHELLGLITQADSGFLSGPRAMEEPGSQAETYLWLLDVLSVAVDAFVKSDPHRPELTPIVSPTRKFGGDNRDAHYHHCRIDPALTYRVRGRRTDAVYIALTVYGGPPDGHWTTRIVGTINDRAMEIADDGTFEVILSPDPHPGNWVQLEPDAVDLVTRDYLADRDTDIATEWSIEVVGPADAVRPAPPRLTDDEIAARLRRATNFISEMVAMFPMPYDPAKANQLDEPYAQPPITYGWAAGDAAYCMGWYDLADDEALVIEGRSPACAFWNLCLWNACIQTYDYRYENVTLNGTQADIDADGSWRIVVSAGDPGVANWLSTAGHPRGVLWFRWFLAESVPDRPTTTVVPVASLR